MKRFVNLVITASLLSFGWSCQQEQLEPVVPQNEGTIEISIELADALQTKSDHDGSAVTTVWYEVYDNKSEERIFPKADSDRTFPAEANASAMATDPDENRLTLTDGKATLQFQTLKNRSYKILFWAMSGTDAPYTWSTLDNISMNYDKSGKRDAFFGSIEVLGQNTSDLSVTLQRPFSLINFGAAKDEIELYNDAPCIRTVIGDEVTYHPYSGAEIEFENVATAFSVASGAPVADSEEELTQAYASLVLNPGDMEGQGYLSIKNEGDTEATDYVYMTASYILAPSEGTTIDMTATFKCLEDGTAETSFTYPLATVPVQANHRTNILGRIFTGSGQLSVSKMVGWEDYNKELWNGETQVITPAEDNVYVVTTAEQLAWVAQQVNIGADTFAGKTVRLGADIDLAGSLWTPIGDSGENSYTHNFQGTFDGDGKTIRNMKVDHPDAGGLFGHMVKGTVRDLTIDGFEITSDHYAGAIAGWIEQGGGNILVTGCKALNGKIEVSVITKDDGMHHDLGDKAGSIVGFGYKGTYTDNVAENVEIRGYRDLGGILGYAHEATVTGNSITNVTIKQNLDIDYKKTEENGDTPTTLGDYVGRISGADNCVIDDNTGTAGIYAPIEGYNAILKYLNTGEYHIFNLEGLKQLNQFFKDNYSANDTWDRSYNISADIDATGFTWESVWMNVGSNDNDGLILDGHGHTISNLTITGGGLLSGTPKGSNEGTTPGVVRDITIDGANVTGDHFTSVFWGNCYGDVMYENVVVRNSKIKGACNVGAFIGGTSIEDGGDIELTFKNCLVTGTTLEATGKDGQDPNGASGYVGRAYGATSITFEGRNNVSNSNITNLNQLVGGTYYGYTTWVDGGFASTGCCDTKTNWGGLVGVIADGLALNEGIYSVSNANGLAKVNEMMADQSMGKNAVIEITDDIDFTGKIWTPVDSHADKKFNISEIIGNNHTIKNLTINGQAMFTRFAGTGDVTIKDVTFENAVVTSSKLNTSILTVQTYQNILLDNVDVKNSTITGAYKVAPLIATVYNEKESTVTAKLKNCDISDVTVKATAYDFCTSGLVAFVKADDGERIEFENCSVTDVKLMAPDDSYKAHAAVYTQGSGSLFNEAEGVTVTNVTFEALE